MRQPKALHLADAAAGPPAGTLLAEIAALPPHGGKDILFKKDDQQINIFIQKSGDTIAVFENRCPHAHTPLNMFGDKFLSLDGTSIICRTHGALFDKTSGQCTGGPCKGDYLTPIAFSVRDGSIYSA